MKDIMLGLVVLGAIFITVLVRLLIFVGLPAVAFVALGRYLGWW